MTALVLVAIGFVAGAGVSVVVALVIAAESSRRRARAWSPALHAPSDRA